MNVLAAIPVLLLMATAVVEAARAVGSVRRARRLNRAMHELRRPLQALGLIVERGVIDPEIGRECMAQARAALAELDAIVNNRSPSGRRRGADLRDVLQSLQARWRVSGVSVTAAAVEGTVPDARRLGAALDNLVANALEHGDGPVSVRAATEAETARFEVRDAGAVEPRESRGRDPRRGHGLEIVRTFAASNGGSAGLRIGSRGVGTSATIRIPIERPQAASTGAGHLGGRP